MVLKIINKPIYFFVIVIRQLYASNIKAVTRKIPAHADTVYPCT